MAATILAFPAEPAGAARPAPVLAAENRHLDAERAAFAAETVADIRVTIDDDVLPILRTAQQALSVMRHALTEIDRRHPLTRSLLTEATALGEVVAALQYIADPTTEPPPPPVGAA
jgi:hypothetical protein